MKKMSNKKRGTIILSLGIFSIVCETLFIILEYVFKCDALGRESIWTMILTYIFGIYLFYFGVKLRKKEDK